MKVYLLKDIANVGLAGSVVKVKDGYAQNFLFPRKMAVQITAKNEAFYAEKAKKVQVNKDAIKTKMGMLAESIKNIHVSIAKRAHDDGKLYGAISADDIVTLLSKKEISIAKKQVVFPKTIKTTGEHKVAVKLSSKLLPELNLKVTAQ